MPGTHLYIPYYLYLTHAFFKDYGGAMQVENLNIESLVEKILEAKAASIVASVVEDYIRRNEERAQEFSLLERIIRVEEELKAQREIQTSILREMNARFEAMDKRFEAVEKRLDATERANQQRFEAIEKRFESLEKTNQQRFELIEKHFESIEKANQQRFEAIDKRFEAVEKRLSFLQWFMGAGFTFLAFLITLINFIH